MSVLVGRQAPDFEAAAVTGNGEIVENFKLSDSNGKLRVLFFWPLDFTFVCPSEIIAHDAPAAEFAANTEGDAGFRVPGVHWFLSARRVMTLD